MLGDYRREVLPNGLRVLGVENRALHSFVCSVYVRMGPRFEPAELRGLSHFLEHMLLQGSERFPTSNAIMRGIEDLGGVLDAGTYPEYMNVVFGVHRKHWRRAMEIAADVILHPLFDAAEAEQEKSIIAQELMQHRDRDGRNISASELAHELLFEPLPDEAGTRGSPDITERFTSAMLEEHYRRFFVPENMVVCLAGGFDFDDVVGDMRKCFGAMGRGAGAPQVTGPALLSGRRRAVYRPTEARPQVDVILAHPAWALGHPRFHAGRAVAHLLGGGLSSRLFAWVREECGLAYDVACYLQGYSDAGAMEVSLCVGEENLVRALRESGVAVERALQDGFTQAELERHKEAARCGVEMLCDRADALADWFGKQELLLGPEKTMSPEEYVRHQEELELDDLGSALADILDGGACLVVVGSYGKDTRKALADLFGGEEVEPLAVKHY